MSELKIITNHVPRHVKYFYDLTEAQQKIVMDDYGYLDEDSRFDGWIEYRDRLYHVSDFLDLNNRFYQPYNPFGEYWHGYLSDSFFSGVLIRFPCDYEIEEVIMGWYLS